jgi:hypothetical protein
MSQFNLTPAEDALVVSALQYLAEVQGAMHGGVSDDVQALITKVTAAPVIEAAPFVEEKPAKSKRADKVEEAPAAE